MASTCSFGPVDLSLDDLKSPPAAIAPPPAPLQYKQWLFEHRLEYGWNFFSLEADQRMKMFNFFLLFVGFIVAGYATLLANGYLVPSTFLAFIAAWLTWCFICLDRRNEELVHIAGDILTSLESDVLFTEYDRPIWWPRRRGWFGKMDPKSEVVRPVGIFRREDADEHGKVREQLVDKTYTKAGRSRYEHGTWIPRLQKSVLILFVILALVPWTPKEITICGQTIFTNAQTKK
jgi:hypothetical protein